MAGRGSPAGPRPLSTHMQGDGQGAAGEMGAGGHPHTVQTWRVPNYDQILSRCFLRVLTTREAFWTCKTKHSSSSRDAESPVFTHSDLALDLLTGARGTITWVPKDTSSRHATPRRERAARDGVPLQKPPPPGSAGLSGARCQRPGGGCRPCEASPRCEARAAPGAEQAGGSARRPQEEKRF